MMWGLIGQFALTCVALSIMFWLGYRRGYAKAYAERLEALAKNARHKAGQAQAEADVLNGVLPPRVRRARIKGTSRRGLKD